MKKLIAIFVIYPLFCEATAMAHNFHLQLESGGGFMSVATDKGDEIRKDGTDMFAAAGLLYKPPQFGLSLLIGGGKQDIAGSESEGAIESQSATFRFATVSATGLYYLHPNFGLGMRMQAIRGIGLDYDFESQPSTEVSTNYQVGPRAVISKRFGSVLVEPFAQFSQSVNLDNRSSRHYQAGLSIGWQPPTKKRPKKVQKIAKKKPIKPKIKKAKPIKTASIAPKFDFKILPPKPLAIKPIKALKPITKPKPPPSSPPLPLVLTASIRFDLDSSTLRPESIQQLRMLSMKLKRNSHRWQRLHIGGHTDATGETLHNSWLSKRRAAATLNFLVSQGIKRHKLTYQGYANMYPINGLPSKSAMHRRVVLRTIPLKALSMK